MTAGGVREPFVMIPRALLYSQVSRPALALWAALDDLARRDVAAAVDQRDLARVIGVEYRQLRYLRAELEDAGFLKVHRRPGRSSLYEPLRRPRHVVPNPVDNAGDNAASTLADGCQGGPLDPGTAVPGSVGSLYPRAREEHERLRRPSWCGQCDDRTRLVDDPTGRPRRCPACHPLAVSPF